MRHTLEVYWLAEQVANGNIRLTNPRTGEPFVQVCGTWEPVNWYLTLEEEAS